MSKPPVTRSRTTEEKEREEIVNRKVTAFIHMCMKKSNADFKKLQSALEKNGMEITISTLRKKVNSGKCKAVFAFEIADALNLNIDAHRKPKKNTK